MTVIRRPKPLSSPPQELVWGSGSRRQSKRPPDFRSRHDIFINLGPIVEEILVHIPNPDFQHMVQEEPREAPAASRLVQIDGFMDCVFVWESEPEGVN